MNAAAGSSASNDEDSRRDGRVRRWFGFVRSLATQIGNDRLPIAAAGVAFYALLAIFPALAALISISGLVLEPAQVAAQLRNLSGIVPPEALKVLTTQLDRLVMTGRGALGFGVFVGLALTLWSASAGMKMVIEAVNLAYNTQERRSFLKRQALGLVMTLGAIVGAAVALAAVIVLPAVIQFLGLRSLLAGVISYARWPILAALAVVAFATLYRYAPSRPPPPWSQLLPGAVTGAAIWIGGSALFSWYVTNFGRYNETYGTVGAVVILLLWFLLTGWSILIGAEINAEPHRREARGA